MGVNFYQKKKNHLVILIYKHSEELYFQYSSARAAVST